MPTKEEVAAVAARVTTLTGERFWAQGESLRPVAGGAPEAGTPWLELDFEDRREAIYVNTDWKGFSLEEQMAITDMVAEGESHTFWEETLDDSPISTPTREQMDAVTQKIGWLESMGYAREEGHAPGPASDTALPSWQDLSRDEQEAVLSADVNWEGFTESQKEDVINRFLEGEEPDFWMDGIGPEAERQPTEGAMGGRFITSEENRAISAYERDCEKRGIVQNAEDRTQWVGHWLGAAEEHRIAGVEAAQLDFRGPEQEKFPSPEESNALAAEIRADEHAARARDYGEADAATYEQRVAEGAATVRHLEPEPPQVSQVELEPVLAEREREWQKSRDEFKAILAGKGPSVEQEPEREQDWEHER